MNSIKINYKTQLLPIIVAKSRCSNSNNNNEHNKDNYCGQTFQDILKEKLKNNASPLSDIPPRTFPVLFNKRLVY
jgi:hypothetical protein